MPFANTYSRTSRGALAFAAFSCRRGLYMYKVRLLSVSRFEPCSQIAQNAFCAGCASQLYGRAEALAAALAAA